MNYYLYKHNRQVVSCEDLCPGKACSTGTVVERGYKVNPKTGERTLEGQDVGYRSTNWVNFEHEDWTPV